MKPEQKPIVERLAWALLCSFVFSLPLEKSVELSGIGTISRLMGIGAFAAGVAAIVRRRALRTSNIALLLAGAFVLWSGLTYFWSVDPHTTALRFGTLAQLVAMVWLIWELCHSAAEHRSLMQAYVAGAAASSVFTMVRYALKQQTYYRRYATAGFDPNDLGITLAIALPMAFYLAFRASGRLGGRPGVSNNCPRASLGTVVAVPGFPQSAWLWRAAAALAIAAILLTASRTALVAGFVAFLFPVLCWRASSTSQRISSAALLGLLVLGTIRLAPPASRARLATLPSELSSGTFNDRKRIWKAGLKVLKRHFVAGIGAGAYPEAVRPMLGRPSIPGHEFVAHNTFLSVLVETGLPGFFLFGLLLCTLGIFIWMLAPAARALWLTTMAVWVTGVSTLTWENRKPTWLLFALIMTAWARAFLPEDKED